MGSFRIYAKTPAGDEAVRQSTRVVQRNLRLVLVQVDGKLTVDELIAKIGNARLVEGAINELEKGGYIVPLAEAAAAWAVGLPPEKEERHSAVSQFSTFGERAPARIRVEEPGPASVFSAFGKPVLPVGAQETTKQETRSRKQAAARSDADEHRSERQWRILPLFGGGLLAFLVAAVLLVFFYPYDNYRGDLEKTASQLLQTPVTIGAVHFVALPTPRLELQNLRLGAAGDAAASIGRVGLPPPWQLFLQGSAAVGRLDVHDLSVPLDALLMLPGVAGDKTLALPALRQVNVEKLQILVARNMAFGVLNGQLNYENGRFAQGRLETQNRELVVAAKPAAGQMALEIEGRAWQPPALPVRFGALDAKATLDVQGLQVREINASFFGGVMKGDWSLGWHESGLAMRGDLLLARVDMQQLSSSVLPGFKWEGALEGALRLQGSGADWAGMWSAAHFDMQAKIQRGTLFGVDLGEASRRGPGGVARGGSTRFDQLSARVLADGRSIALNDLQLDAGAMNAAGVLRRTPDGQLDGRMMVNVRSSVANIRVPVRISGALPNSEVLVER